MYGKNLEVLMLEATYESEDAIVNANTDQLWAGIKADGKNMPDYSQTSVNAFGKPSGPIRLYDSGDFYRGLFVS